MDVILDKPLMLSPTQVSSEPFRYFVSTQGFSYEASLIILKWLETDAPWKLVEAEFYEQYEFNFLDACLPPQLKFLQEKSFLADLREKVENMFQVELSDRIDLNAHKLVPGQRIRLHNDYIPDQETHRLIIQLNRGWTDEQGGLLMFFNSSNPADIHKVILPFHNSVVGFAISRNSNHAVSTIRNGQRFSLVYSFYEKNGYA